MEKCHVVLMPFPLTLRSAFAYWLLEFLEIATADTFVRYHYSSLTRGGEIQLGGGSVWNFATTESTKELEARLHQLINESKSRVEVKKALSRLLNFCQPAGMSGQAPAKQKEVAFQIARISLANQNQLPLILEEVATIWDWYYDSNLDPNKSPLPRWSTMTSQSKILRDAGIPKDTHHITLPFLKPAEGRVGFAEYAFQEGRVWNLVNSSTAVAIFGSPGVGKTTFNASLFAEAINRLKSWLSRRDWQGLDLKIGCSTVDFADNVLELVKKGHGQNRGLAQENKRSWSTELVEEADAHLKAELAKHNLVFVDYPGLDSPISERLAARAELGIILGRDNDEIRRWRNFCHRLGVTVISELSITTLDTHQAGYITQYRQGEKLIGTIAPLERVMRAWDHPIDWLSMILLTDIIPQQTESRLKELTNLVKTAPPP